MSLASYSSYQENEIRVAFLFKTLQYIKWNTLLKDENSPIVICTNAPDPLLQIMKSLDGRKTVGRTIVIKPTPEFSPDDRCSVAYIREKTLNNFRSRIVSLKQSPVVTVNDDPDYSEAGGVINYLLKNNRIVIGINIDIATEKNIQFSAKFLRITEIIRDKN